MATVRWSRIGILARLSPLLGRRQPWSTRLRLRHPGRSEVRDPAPGQVPCRPREGYHPRRRWVHRMRRERSGQDPTPRRRGMEDHQKAPEIYVRFRPDPRSLAFVVEAPYRVGRDVACHVGHYRLRLLSLDPHSLPVFDVSLLRRAPRRCRLSQSLVKGKSSTFTTRGNWARVLRHPGPGANLVKDNC
jgi:hypothetical protein